MNPFLSRLNSNIFNVIVEFTPKTQKDLKDIAELGKKLSEANSKYKDKGIVFSAVTITQNPAGRLSYDAVQAVKFLKENGLPEEIEIVPHITCKDQNVDAIENQLRALIDLGIRNILALTGDKPPKAQAVFQIDSIGLLMLINRINANIAKQAKTVDALKKCVQLYAGSAISPFKYTEASFAMQYIKAEKKISCGTQFFISQAGWDVEKSKELIKRKKAYGVPILGNALFLDYSTVLPMKDLPGCVVIPQFIEKLKSEKYDDHIKRTAQQIAMFKSLGYNGVDLGNVLTYEQIIQIIDMALEIKNWEEFSDNISFPPPPQKNKKLSKSPATLEYLHKQAFEEKGALFNISKKVLEPFEKSYQKGYGPLYKAFFGAEQFIKGTFFDCRLCGDCYLPENYFVCTEGSCKKGLPNPPCGDADAQGMCGNDANRPCAAELIYYRAAKKDDIKSLKKKIFGSRDISLFGSSSFLNHYFGRSHSFKTTLKERSKLIQIAELLHATIPSVGPAMQLIKEMGDEGFTKYNPGLNVVIDLIISQAAYQPAYIDINIDQLRENTPQLIRKFIKLIKTYSMGIPVCIDSSNVEVLKAGLEEWYSEGNNVKPPMINSINYAELEKMRPILKMRRDIKFGIVGLLTGPTGVLKSPDEMYEAAKVIFKEALSYGFKPQEIFFDTVTLGVTFDSPFNELGEIKTSHTYNSFNAIKKIMSDPEMKGVNASLGVSNWTHGVAKRRIGHIRAFIEVAMSYGLNAVISDVSQEYGIKPTQPELVEFVKMFANLDGSEESFLTYNTMIKEFRTKKWV